MNNQFEYMQKLAFGKVLINKSKITESSLRAKIKKILKESYDKPKFHRNMDEDEIFSEKVGEELQRLFDEGEITQNQFDKALNKLSEEYYELWQRFGSSDEINQAVDELLDSINLQEAKKKKQKDVAPQEDIDIELPTEDPAAEPSTEPSAELPADPTNIEAPATDINPTVKSIQDALQKAYAQAKALGDEKLATQIGNTITMLVRDQVLGGGQKAIAENLLASEDPEGSGVHITGFDNDEIDSLYLTTDKSDHDDVSQESTTSSKGIIRDRTTGATVYWSFGLK